MGVAKTVYSVFIVLSDQDSLIKSLNFSKNYFDTKINVLRNSLENL